MQTEGSAGAHMNIILWTVMIMLREDVDIVTACLCAQLTKCNTQKLHAAQTPPP